MSHALIDQRLDRLAAGLGAALAAHPVTQRLKRIEEQIREDPGLLELWHSLEETERGGGCRTGGSCGSGGCGTGGGEGEGPEPPPEAPDKLRLMASFSDAPLLQEYVQVKHRFYALVDRAYETIFQQAYGKSWMGEPEVDVAAEPLAEPELAATAD